MPTARFTPSLFDKLTGSDTPGDAANAAATARPYYTVPGIDRYNTTAVKNVLRRELDWLFNTTNLATTVDLSDVPQVQRSVLNYGVVDLSGKAITRHVLEQRARDMRTAIRLFEPRLSSDQLDVEVQTGINEQEDAVTFVVRSDVLSPIQPLPVTYKTDVEVDSGTVMVRD